MQGLVIDYLGGYCPVQAEGTVNGVPFCFRARHQTWQMSIGSRPAGWLRTERWGSDAEDAGWMDHDIARGIVERCAKEYVEGHHAKGDTDCV
jgi:hypothetical protein